MEVVISVSAVNIENASWVGRKLENTCLSIFLDPEGIITVVWAGNDGK